VTNALHCAYVGDNAGSEWHFVCAKQQQCQQLKSSKAAKKQQIRVAYLYKLSAVTGSSKIGHFYDELVASSATI
jgi:hypothetical protein